MHAHTLLGPPSAAREQACELRQNRQADVRAVTSELNEKGDLWKITRLKMSSVTSAPLRFPDRAVAVAVVVAVVVVFKGFFFSPPKTQMSNTLSGKPCWFK